MPAASDWRSAHTADMLMRLDQEQFAVAFLRRNPAYGDDYRNTQNRIAAGSLSHDAGMAGLARRWGCAFRMRPIAVVGFPACGDRNTAATVIVARALRTLRRRVLSIPIDELVIQHADTENGRHVLLDDPRAAIGSGLSRRSCARRQRFPGSFR